MLSYHVALRVISKKIEEGSETFRSAQSAYSIRPEPRTRGKPGYSGKGPTVAGLGIESQRTVKVHRIARLCLEKSGNFDYENEQSAYT
jgi:hypothetical protein